MDTALLLKIEIEHGKTYSKDQILRFLHQSDLVKELTADLPEKSLPLVWRLIGISEIPYIQLLDYCHSLILKVYEKLATPYGFSLSGDQKMFLPCYNAMIATALCRLGRAGDPEVKNAIDWILANQPMQRGQKVELPGFNFERYGGCFNKTPCYIGLAKSVFALNEYKDQGGSTICNSKLLKGTDYMLQHKFFKRLKNNQPINQHITDISFPETYHLNAVELIRFAGKRNLIKHINTKDLITFLKNKQNKDGFWKSTFRYKAEGYVNFDKGRNAADWSSATIKHALKNENDN